MSRVSALALLALGPLAMAQSTGGPSVAETTPPGWNSPPSQPAIDACLGKKEGDRVQFVDPKGKTRQWGCVTVKGVLAARSGVPTAKVKSPK
jgi:hypothetical protein